jgi:outer membrane murein-binding lipoprotein Lpp
MTIELALLISLVSVAFGVYSGVRNLSRNNRKDTIDETSQMTTVVVKLENIASGVHEIKSDVREMKSEMNGLRERLTIAEQVAKSAHKRIDEITHEVTV